MAELIPIPLHLQLARAFAEYERQGKIFDLPKAKFYRGIAGLDTSVRFHGYRAATPLGPAAGPHDQLIQNIVLSWLGGSRIIELKTVQILDELKIPRPCIDMANVGYNVEWSQELKLEQSLREYVGAMMMIEVLKASHLLGDEFDAPGMTDTVFDMSVGYNLEGISSPRVRAWMERMKDATPVIDELRGELAGPFARFRDLPFPARVSDTLTLSTFHGCPAKEIEGIVRFLLTEMDLHVVIKLNPTLLGKQHVEHLLHDVLGYTDIRVTQDAFDHDLQFEQALEIIPRLEAVARSRGKRLGVKFSNTLVVKNHKTFFGDDTMYMSGAPLHVVTLNLVEKFRAALGRPIPTSFSAGLDANNIAYCVAMNLVPVTTCTDLLRPGGYSRLVRYMERLGENMRELGTAALPDFVVRFAGKTGAAAERVVEDLKRDFRSAAGGDTDAVAPALAWADNMLAFRLRAWAEQNPEPLAAMCDDVLTKFRQGVSSRMPEALAAQLDAGIASLADRMVEAAGLLNTPAIVKQATENPRYRFENNKTTPRKIGSHLWLYDCINCDKCVPDCPNDANFVYDTPEAEIPYVNYDLTSTGHLVAADGGVFKISKQHQLANFADACNDCGNCDVFCPEDGGPQIEKPRFFSSFASFRKDAGRNGFLVEFDAGSRTIHGVIAGAAYVLTVGHERAWFDDGAVELEIALSDSRVLAVHAKPAREPGSHKINMLAYHQLKILLESISNPSRVHYANVAEFQGKSRDQKDGALPRARLHHHAGMD